MAKVPFAEPQAAEITPERVGGEIPPQAAGMVSGEIADIGEHLASKLQEADLNQRITQGSLTTLGTLEKTIQDIQQSNDWKNAHARFGNAVTDLQQQINSSDNPDSVKTALLNHLTGYSITRGHDLNAWVYSQNVADKQATLETSLQQFVRLGAEAAPKQRALLFQQAMGAIEGMRSSGVLTDADAEKMSRITGQTFDYNAAMLDIMKQPGSTFKALKDPKQYENLMPEQRAELMIHAQREQNVQGEAQAAVLKDKVDDALDSAAQFGTFNNAIIAQVNNSGDPKLIAKFNSSLSRALQTHDAIARMASASPEDRATILQSLAPKPDSEGFAEQQHLYEVASKANQELDRLTEKDPAAIVAPRINPSLNPGEQVLQSVNLQKSIGIPNPKPLTDEQVGTLVKDYTAAPVESKTNFLDSLKATYGITAYEQIQRQVFSKMPPSFMFADEVSPSVMKKLSTLDPVTLEVARNQVGEAKSKEITKDVDAEWNTYSQAIPGNTPEQSVLKTTFEKLSLDYAHGGDTDAVNHAARDLFGNYTFNGTWMAPVGTDIGKLTKYAESRIESQPSFYGANNDFETHAIRSGLQALNRWQYDKGENRYYLLDGSGMPVFDGDKQPISFSLPAAQMYEPPPSTYVENQPGGPL